MNARVLVTGGASGIGASTCHRLSQRGVRVGILDRNLEQASEVAAAVGGVAARADVRDAAQVDAATAEIAAALGGLDGLVNNAGVGSLKPLEAHTDTEWARLIGVNLTGAFNVLRSVVPYLRAAGGGAIVNVSSLSGLRPTRGEAPYSVAKAGLIALTMSAALEFAPSIRVNAVSPGFVQTPLTDGVLELDGVRAGLEAGAPLGRLATADEVAATIVFLLSDEASYVTGHNLVVDGGASLVHAQADPMLKSFLAMIEQAGQSTVEP